MPGAGTDKTKNWVAEPGPIVVLVEPQLGENIGASARAMANFGLSQMRLVKPRQAWPNEKAHVMAAGADRVLEGAVLYDTAAAAVADCNMVFAATARAHDQAKPVVGPEEAVRLMAPAVGAGQNVAILFGRERYGLEGHEVGLADRVVTFPINPAFASLNLSQAVLVMAYEWFKLAGSGSAVRDAAEVATGNQAAVARVLRQPGARTGQGRVLPPAGEARRDAAQPAQHLSPHGADAAGHPDAARRDPGDCRRPQGTGARRPARQRRGADASRAARRARQGQRLRAPAARCAACRGCCAAIRPTPSARCGTSSPRIAASPATTSSGRPRSGRMSPTWCRSGCGLVVELVPPDETEAAKKSRAERHAWLTERNYSVIELPAADVGADVGGALDRIAAAISPSAP